MSTFVSLWKPLTVVKVVAVVNIADALASEGIVNSVGIAHPSDSRGIAGVGDIDDPLDIADIPDTTAHTDTAGTRDTEEGCIG